MERSLGGELASLIVTLNKVPPQPSSSRHGFFSDTTASCLKNCLRKKAFSCDLSGRKTVGGAKVKEDADLQHHRSFFADRKSSPDASMSSRTPAGSLIESRCEIEAFEPVDMAYSQGFCDARS